MTRPKRTPTTPKALKQTTLFRLLDSPSRSSPRRPNQASNSKFQTAAVSPKRKRTDKSHPTLSSNPGCEGSSSDLEAIRLEPRVIDVNEADEDELPVPSVAKKRKTRIVTSDDDGDDDAQHVLPVMDGNESQEEQGGGVQWKGRHKWKSRHINNSDSEDKLQPRRRKLVKGIRPTSSPLNEGEDGDISDEIDEDRILESRLRVRGKKTIFQKNLEKLKRKKLGHAIESSASDEGEDGEETEDSVKPFKGAKPDSSSDSLFDGSNHDDSDSDDFIVEDDGTIPTVLPMEFSMEAREDLAHQFKKIFQFFVHIAVRPAVERHQFMEKQMKTQQYFSVPLQIVRRKLDGLRDSLVVSSVWRPEFKQPLEKFPEFALIPLSFAIPVCDACHLGRRMSTLTGRLSGTPYDRLGFEDESDDSDSGDTEDSDEPKQTVVEFRLGRFCAKRTRVFHKFTHWEYSLFKCICQEVDDLHIRNQGGKFFRVAYAGGIKPPKDLGDADGICDWLDQRKVIDMEWLKVKDMMESARHLEMAAKGGEDIDD